MRGAYLEAAGDLEGAEQAYLDAVRLDDESAGTWTRIGAIRCRVDLGGGLRAFDQALEADPLYAEGWSERARCLLRHGRRKRALDSARTALKLDPDATSPSLLLAEIVAVDDPERAGRWLLALVLRSPGPAEHWQALARHGEPDSPLARWARRELQRRRLARDDRAAPSAPEPGEPSAEATATRAALMAGDLDGARLVAMQEGVSPTTLVHLALSLGCDQLARAQARLVVEARPRDPDAVILSLVTSDRFGEVAIDPAIQRTPGASRVPSAPAARLLEDLLRAHAGEREAREWTRAYERASRPH